MPISLSDLSGPWIVFPTAQALFNRSGDLQVPDMEKLKTTLSRKAGFTTTSRKKLEVGDDFFSLLIFLSPGSLAKPLLTDLDSGEAEGARKKKKKKKE